jgi:hypothetical protein
MIVTLQPDEIQVCQMVGRMRSLIARGNGVRDAKMGDQDGSEADVMGMMAEYGFAKEMNVFPDLGLTPRSGSADGVSLPKVRVMMSRHLSIKEQDCSVRSRLILMWIFMCCAWSMDRPFDFKGWAWKRELIMEENKMNLGHGVGYALEQSKLRKF